MPSILEYIEAFLGYLFSSFRGRDAGLFTKSPAFADQPNPNLEVHSPECGASSSSLLIHHTPLGENRFPELTWSVPSTLADPIKEYLLVVEDPDAPLPAPIVHGIYYSLPAIKRQVGPADFKKVSGSNLLQGGFRHGKNRKGIVWSGPRPVLNHGPHRYFFSVVALKEVLDLGALSETATPEELKEELVGKVAGWGEWIGVYERTLK